MSILTITLVKNAANYAEELTAAPWNVTNALDLIASYHHNEAGRSDDDATENEFYKTVVTEANLIIRADSYNPEGHLKSDVARYIRLMGGTKEAQKSAVLYALDALETILNDAAVGSITIHLDENGVEFNPTENEEAPRSAEDFGLDEDAETEVEDYEPTFSEMRRAWEQQEELITATANKMLEGALIYDEENLTLDQLAAVIELVQTHYKALHEILWYYELEEATTLSEVLNLYKILKKESILILGESEVPGK